MFYALNWFAIASLLTVWSLLAWLLNALAVWTLTHAAALPGAASTAAGVVLPDWLTAWVAPEFLQSLSQALSFVGSVLASVLSAAPALAGSVTVAAWVFWGLGAFFLLLLGIAMHLLITRLRRRTEVTASGAMPRPPVLAH